MSFKREEILDGLTLEKVFDLLQELGGEPEVLPEKNLIVSRTICHNSCCGSKKLYYYHESRTFHCFTECGSNFSIFDLMIKVHMLKGESFSISEAISFVGKYFGITPTIFEKKSFDFFKHKSWEILENYESLDNKRKQYERQDEKIVLEEKENIIQHYPVCEIASWKKEGISFDTIKRFHIKFDPIQYGALIPHYDENNRLVGIRQRTLVKEQEDFGKYRPYVNSQYDFRHPLSLNLFGLNKTKENIRKIKKAIVYEGEKSVLLQDSLFGEGSNFSCASCGCSLNEYQVRILLSYGVEEIIIGYDRQFVEIGDEEYIKWIEKLAKIRKKYSHYCKITFLFDEYDILQYKSSPIDEGKEKFLRLMRQRHEI